MKRTRKKAKWSRRANGPKEKAESIYAKTRGVVSSIEFGVDQETGAISFSTPMVEPYLERSYKREGKGDKVLSRIPFTEQEYVHGRNAALWANYDYVAAIDTNTMDLAGHRVSIMVLAQAVKRIVVDVSGCAQTAWSYSIPRCFEFTDTWAAAEKVGWGLGISELLSARVHERYRRIGVVVDAHLSEINNVNARKVPVLDGWLLPPACTLIYASSDAGKDDFANKLIGIADGLAKTIAARLRENWDFPSNCRAPSSAPFLTIRALVPKNACDFE